MTHLEVWRSCPSAGPLCVKDSSAIDIAGANQAVCRRSRFSRRTNAEKLHGKDLP